MKINCVQLTDSDFIKQGEFDIYDYNGEFISASIWRYNNDSYLYSFYIGDSKRKTLTTTRWCGKIQTKAEAIIKINEAIVVIFKSFVIKNKRKVKDFLKEKEKV